MWSLDSSPIFNLRQASWVILWLVVVNSFVRIQQMLGPLLWFYRIFHRTCGWLMGLHSISVDNFTKNLDRSAVLHLNHCFVISLLAFPVFLIPSPWSSSLRSSTPSFLFPLLVALVSSLQFEIDLFVCMYITLCRFVALSMWISAFPMSLHGFKYASNLDVRLTIYWTRPTEWAQFAIDLRLQGTQA